MICLHDAHTHTHARMHADTHARTHASGVDINVEAFMYASIANLAAALKGKLGSEISHDLKVTPRDFFCVRVLVLKKQACKACEYQDEDA